MLFRKKKEQPQISIYDRKWNEIIYRRSDIERNISNLFAKIQYSTDALSCFEKDSPNWKSEQEYLSQLRYKMLCECGAYDGTSYEIREVLKDRDKLQPRFCVNYDPAYKPTDCNEYLRYAAQRFKRYGD